VDLRVFRRWCTDPDLLTGVRGLFAYGAGEDRATGYIYAAGEQDWPDGFPGPFLLEDLERDLEVRFTVALFQAYRNGAGCEWHTDDPFDAQAVLSLGVTRTFGVRPVGGEPEWVEVGHGDLVYMPPGFQQEYEHCVPVEGAPGERYSLVFRTVRKD
jgi:alkylated DNA repair dioxygenase AlkB